MVDNTAKSSGPQLGSSDSNQISTTQRSKKRFKRDNERTQREDPPRCHLNTIPLEILAEILSYTTPRDILALARSNKFFCATFANNPSSTFIWKRSRADFNPNAIPDPTPNFTEASYAAFLFDPGKCEVCKKKSKLMYASFTLRLRFCGKPHCKTKWRSDQAEEIQTLGANRYKLLTEWMPRAEIRDFGYTRSYLEGLIDVSNPIISMFRKTDWQEAVDQFNKASLSVVTMHAYTEQMQPLVARLGKIMEHGVKLVRWRNRYDAFLKLSQTINLTLAQNTASTEGWQLWDLLQTPSYGMLYRCKNRASETTTPQDYNRIRSCVEAEIFQLLETRKRRAEETAYRKRRDDVEKYHRQLKENGSAGLLPTLSEFRKLPMVQRMQQKSTNASDTGIARDLKQSKLLNDLIKEDLSRWREGIKNSLGALLGFPNWKSTSRTQLHPVDRPNARFLCKRCEASIGAGNGRNESMDFAEICQHRCVPLSKKSRDTWKVENFVPDVKAIDVINQLLMACGSDADDVGSLQAVKNVGLCILCLSCPSRIVMGYDSLLRHCQRHDKMSLELLPVAQAQVILNQPMEISLYTQLTHRSQVAVELRARRIYGCRHCEQSNISLDMEAPLSAPGTTHMSTMQTPAESSTKLKEKTRGSHPKAGQGKPLKLFGFDGFRSHAKEKHGIALVGDEDFFRQSEEGARVGN